MANVTLDTRLIICNDTSAAWGSSEKVLLKGEMAIEFPESGAPKFKFGNGIDKYSVLPYANMTPAEITNAIAAAVDSAKHSHSNKDILDAITAAFTTELKTKLDGISAGAEVNQNAFSNIKVGNTTIEADTKTDTLTLAGSNVTITPDATNDKITIGVANGSTTAKGIVQLTDSTSSTSTTTAATPKSVKSAYDLANTAKTAAEKAQASADGKVGSVSLESGTDNGTVKLTVDGTATDNIKVKGLGSAAYTNSKSYATAAQGTKADNAMPKSGGTFTGGVTLNADPTAALEAATKQYVDAQILNKISASDAMVFKGTLGTNGTVTAIPTTGVVKGDTYKIISAGTYAGSTCKVGDLLIALNSGSVTATVENWAYVPSGNENETYISYSTTTQNLTTAGKTGAIVLGEGATKQVDSSVASGTTSTNLPTSAAVAGFVDGKVGELNKAVSDHAGNTTVHITAAERTKWNSAEPNQNAFSKVKVGDTTVDADTKTDTLTLEAGSNVTITPDATNDKITIAAKDTTYTGSDGITVKGTTIGHTNSIAASTAGGSDSKTLSFGGTFEIPKVDYDDHGHITGKGTTTMTMPAAPSSVTGNAGSATKLQNARKIDGVSFNGTADITHYGTCDTTAATQAKVVSLAGFSLVTGARALVKFTVTNTAGSPTLNINGTGAKNIFYRGASISKGVLSAKRIYEFVYDGTNYELVGDIDANAVTNTLSTTTKAYVTGTTSAATNTGTQIFDTGVYLDTEAGALVAEKFKGNLEGNASTASKLQQEVRIGKAAFDGSKNLTLKDMGIYDPIEITKAEYEEKKNNGTLDPNAYYNILYDFDSSTVINDATASENQTYSSKKLENLFAKKPTYLTATLLSSGWTGSAAPYSYTVACSAVTANSLIEITYNPLISRNAINAYKNADFLDGGQKTGSFVIQANNKPTVDLEINILVNNNI